MLTAAHKIYRASDWPQYAFLIRPFRRCLQLTGGEQFTLQLSLLLEVVEPAVHFINSRI